MAVGVFCIDAVRVPARMRRVGRVLAVARLAFPRFQKSQVSRVQRIELLLFSAFFFAFAFFHQGGGWNQNARFAEVRAIVEEGRFAIDDFIVYEVEEGSPVLRRNAVDHTEYERKGKRFRLAWVDMDWNLFPVNEQPPQEGITNAAMVEICASGDIGYVPWTGHFHPNKPPGTALLGAPGYFVLFHLERLLGIDPDHWWVLTLNAWLTTVCSVGVISAFGCVAFFRLAREFAGGAEVPAVLATVAFAFGTTFFPFATIFFDHALTASLLIGAFYFVRQSKGPGWLVAAGVCAGLAAVTNYIAAVAGFFIALYALLALRGGRQDWRAVAWFSLGVLGPFVLICWYNFTNFGSPFRLNTDFQNPLFKETRPALFGMFAIPQSVGEVARLGYLFALLTVSPFRGLFYVAPVLVMGVVGLVLWLKNRQHVAEARLCLAIFGFFLLVNMTFNGYHGGFSAGPRYLVPGIPFLGLPLVAAFARWRRVTLVLALVSVSLQLLLTATDAQNPTGIGGHARVEGLRDEWDYDLIGDYAWPLFARGRAWPLLEGQMKLQLEKEEDRITAEIEDPAAQERELNAVRRGMRESIERGEASPFLLGSVVGPVSVVPIGVFEGLFTYGFFPPGSLQCRWASFNVGEFLFPQSRWSLVPLLLVSGGLVVAAVRLARRTDQATS